MGVVKKIIAGIVLFHVLVAMLVFVGLMDGRSFSDSIRIGYEVTMACSVLLGFGLAASFIIRTFFVKD